MFDDPRPEQPLPRGPTSQPYRGPARVRRSDGRREIWVEGQGYVPENSLGALPANERSAVLEARQAALEAQTSLPDLDRFMALNRGTPQQNRNLGNALGELVGLDVFNPSRGQRTGGILDIIGGMGNQAPMWDEQAQEMHSITDRLAPLQRRPGSGSSTDTDVALFRSGLPNIRRGGQANARIAEQLRLNAGDLQDYGEFLEWYAGRNQTTSGALEQFNQYRALGRRGVRPPWRQHFGAGPTPGARPVRPPAAPPTRAASASPQSIRIDRNGQVIP